ncbi:unnamed protein product [Prunus armeniaca]
MAKSSFFTDVLLQGVRLPLQPAVKRILAQIGYAPGQFNPNFWVALMGVVTAFGMAGEGEPSYDVTKSKSADHGGWVQANCLKATERGNFVNAVPTSQKTWRKRRVLLSGDWESPSGHSFFSTFPRPSKLPVRHRTVRQIEAAERYTSGDLADREGEAVGPSRGENLPEFKAIIGNLTDLCFVVIEERRAAEAKRMNESSKWRLMLGMQGKKKKWRQPETAPASSGRVDPEDLTLNERRRQMNAESARAEAAATGQSPSRGMPTEGTSSKAAGRRPFTVDQEADLAPKRGRQAEPARAIFAAEDDEAPPEAVTLACPLKTVQFVNHMILGSQMELSDIEDLPKKLLREEAGRAFRLQASALMDMWLCVKAKVAESGKAIQPQANLAKDMQAAERQVKAYQAKLGEMSAPLESAQLAAKEALESKEAIQVAFEESERVRASEIEAAVQEAIRGYR